MKLVQCKEQFKIKQIKITNKYSYLTVQLLPQFFNFFWKLINKSSSVNYALSSTNGSILPTFDIFILSVRAYYLWTCELAWPAVHFQSLVLLPRFERFEPPGNRLPNDSR